MARWSHAMPLNRDSLSANRGYLDGHGVYELGLIRKWAGTDYFYPKYVGKADSATLYQRLSSYIQPSQRRAFLHSQMDRVPGRIWFHVFRSHDPAATEALLMDRFAIRDEGLYAWNTKTERKALLAHRQKNASA